MSMAYSILSPFDGRVKKIIRVGYGKSMSFFFWGAMYMGLIKSEHLLM
jgi:hypothetical protein